MRVAKNKETTSGGEHAVIEGTHQGKIYRLRRRRQANGDYSPFWYVDFETGGKRYNQSTGTASRGEAHLVAKKKMAAAMEKRWTALDNTKLKQDAPTIGKVIEVFKAGIGARGKVGKRSRDGYVNMLRSLLRTAHGEEKMEDLRTTVLTRELMQKFKDLRFPANGTIEEQEQAVTSINSTITQARGLFSKRALELYKDHGLDLPDLSGFLSVDKFKDERDVSFRPIAPSILAEMDAAAWALLNPDPERARKNAKGNVDDRLVPARPDVLVAYLMARYLGMRDIEIVAARWDWIEKWPGGWRMAIVKRADFRPKYTEGRVPMSEKLKKVLEKHGKKEDGSPWIVPARTKTDRTEAVYRDCNFFLRRWLGDRQKGMHELRKQAGSEIYTKTKSLSMAAEFLRNKLETCAKHYATLLVPPPALTFSMPVL